MEVTPFVNTDSTSDSFNSHQSYLLVYIKFEQPCFGGGTPAELVLALGATLSVAMKSNKKNTKT